MTPPFATRLSGWIHSYSLPRWERTSSINFSRIFGPTPARSSARPEAVTKTLDGTDVLAILLPGVTLNDAIPHVLGEFADVWKGEQDGNQVRIKTFRSHKLKQVCGESLKYGGKGELNLKQSFYREIVGWKLLSHPYVPSFLGVSETRFQFFIITPWLQCGNTTSHTLWDDRYGRLHLVCNTISPPTNRLRTPS